MRTIDGKSEDIAAAVSACASRAALGEGDAAELTLMLMRLRAAAAARASSGAPEAGAAPFSEPDLPVAA